MRIAIIGATGMLGHHAARAAIARGHHVHVVHRATSKLELLEGLEFTAAQADLDDAESLAAALDGADAVINCAGYYPTLPRPWEDEVRTAVAQMDNFYEACSRHALRKIVYLGGAIALQKHPRGEPADETCSYDGPPPNKNPYVQVKWAMDAHALRRAREGLPVTIGIPSMTFGEYDAGPTTGRLVVEIANGTLPGYVRGQRNVIYAGDAGAGLVRVCEDGRVGERYLLTGENVSMDELIQRIAVVCGVDPPGPVPLPMARLVSKLQTLSWKYLKSDPPKVDATAIAVMSAGQFLDGAKAQRELGFEAQVSLEGAIKRALTWFQDHGYVR